MKIQNYTINKNSGDIDIKGDIDLRNKELENFPEYIRF